MTGQDESICVIGVGRFEQAESLGAPAPRMRRLRRVFLALGIDRPTDTEKAGLLSSQLLGLKEQFFY